MFRRIVIAVGGTALLAAFGTAYAAPSAFPARAEAGPYVGGVDAEGKTFDPAIVSRVGAIGGQAQERLVPFDHMSGDTGPVIDVPAKAPAAYGTGKPAATVNARDD